jgi:hypothetical protein
MNHHEHLRIQKEVMAGSTLKTSQSLLQSDEREIERGGWKRKQRIRREEFFRRERLSRWAEPAGMSGRSSFPRPHIEPEPVPQPGTLTGGSSRGHGSKAG